MGTLDTSVSITQNSTKLLNDVMNSKMNQLIEESLATVEYYNINDSITTTQTFTGNVDEMLGPNSPIRFNYIENLPIIGLKEVTPVIDEIEEGLIDLNIEKEVSIFPNSIRPCVGDCFIYRFINGRSLFFVVSEFEFGTIKSNDYIQLKVYVKDIDNQNKYEERIKRAVVDSFNVDLEQVGTNNKLIINNKILDKIKEVEKICSDLTNRYIDLFFNAQYNCTFLSKGFKGYGLYDPFLVKFLSNNNLLDTQKDYRVMVNYDNRPEVKTMYNKTLFRNIETRDIRELHKLTFGPTNFTTAKNPFYYYAEDVVFSMDLIEDSSVVIPQNIYMRFELIDSIKDNTITPRTSLFDSMIIKYLNEQNMELLVTEDELKSLYNSKLDYDMESFLIVPIIIYILKHYIIFLKQK